MLVVEDELIVEEGLLEDVLEEGVLSVLRVASAIFVRSSTVRLSPARMHSSRSEAGSSPHRTDCDVELVCS